MLNSKRFIIIFFFYSFQLLSQPVNQNNAIVKTKYIEIRHYFIRDLVESKIVLMEHVKIEHKLSNFFMNSQNGLRFEFLRKANGVCFLP